MLATEMFKMYRSMYPTIFSELFRRRDIFCNSQNNNNFAAPIAKSAFHGSESISYLGPKILDIVPLEVKVSMPSKRVLKNGNQEIVLAG